MHRNSDSAALKDDSRLKSSFLFSFHKVGTPITVISELNGWPTCAPVERFILGLTVTDA